MTEEHDQMDMPILALRDVVVYPHMVIPLFVGRNKSIQCLEFAMENNKQIFLVAQKDASIDEPTADDIYTTGTIATILQLLKLPDGTVKVLVEGSVRGAILQYDQHEPFFKGRILSMIDELINHRQDSTFKERLMLIVL